MVGVAPFCVEGVMERWLRCRFRDAWSRQFIALRSVDVFSYGIDSKGDSVKRISQPAIGRGGIAMTRSGGELEAADPAPPPGDGLSARPFPPAKRTRSESGRACQRKVPDHARR